MSDVDYVNQVDLTQTGFGYTMKLIGGKYKLLILYALALNEKPVRFNMLERQLGNVTHKTLTNSLQELAHAGLVKRTAYSEIPPRVDYQLTDQGRSLLPVMDTICRWGELQLNQQTC